MKLNNKLVVVITILLLITIHQTYSKQEKAVDTCMDSSVHTKNIQADIDLFNPSNIILVKLP